MSKPRALHFAILSVAGAVVLLTLLIGGSLARANSSGNMVRWDIISVNFAANTAGMGGVASARADDNSKITFTGSGTFVAPASGSGTSSAVTGGGNWETFDSSGASTGSGTYEVKGLVRWEQAPFTAFPPPADLIGNPNERSPGLVILRVAYSDGSRGTLVLSCHFMGTPPSVFQGITASKGFVDYWNRLAPVQGVDGNRTQFHVSK